jgi:lipid-A-disaccharide synthase-like uncharacterized protein
MLMIGRSCPARGGLQTAAIITMSSDALWDFFTSRFLFAEIESQGLAKKQSTAFLPLSAWVWATLGSGIGLLFCVGKALCSVPALLYAAGRITGLHNSAAPSNGLRYGALSWGPCKGVACVVTSAEKIHSSGLKTSTTVTVTG